MAAAIASCVLSVHFFGSSAMRTVYLVDRKLESPRIKFGPSTLVQATSQSGRGGPDGVTDALRSDVDRAQVEPRRPRARSIRQPTAPAAPATAPGAGAHTRSSITGIAGPTFLLGQCAPQQCAPAPAPAAPHPPPPLQQVVDLTNQQRAANGLPALSVDHAAVAAAQAHSNDQAARDQMSHNGSDGSNAGDRIRGRATAGRRGPRTWRWATPTPRRS